MYSASKERNSVNSFFDWYPHFYGNYKIKHMSSSHGLFSFKYFIETWFCTVVELQFRFVLEKSNYTKCFDWNELLNLNKCGLIIFMFFHKWDFSGIHLLLGLKWNSTHICIIILLNLNNRLCNVWVQTYRKANKMFYWF